MGALTYAEPLADDRAGIRRVLERAFAQPDEADLVLALEDGDRIEHALVARVASSGGDAREVVGYVAFSEVIVQAGRTPGARTGREEPLAKGWGLAPLAVEPGRQRTGIGSELTRRGLREARRRGVGFVVVLGDPAYYSRFGFVTASTRGLASIYGAPTEAFRVLELEAGSLPADGGLVRYVPELE